MTLERLIAAAWMLLGVLLLGWAVTLFWDLVT